jgi:predicted nucleotide-binding protein (sugar kinase/HSP70/actin superfamily)
VADNNIVKVEQDRTGDCRIGEYFVWLIKILLRCNRLEQVTVRFAGILCG